jgi:hypothetical protein
MLSVKYEPLMLNVIMLKPVMLSVVKRIVVEYIDRLLYSSN